jgi:single-strand DNA-binding protein
MTNRFQGTGNLGAKPELKHVDQNGETLAILDMRIYFDRRVPSEGDDSFEDRGGFWITASLWGRRAEIAAGILDKGMRLFAMGTLLSDAWVDPDTSEARVEMRLRLDYVALDLARIETVQMTKRQAA